MSLVIKEAEAYLCFSLISRSVVGHKMLKTTMGYIHVADDRLDNTVSKLPKLGAFYFLGVTAVRKNGWNKPFLT